MKALSVRQPWASMIARGEKQIEFRSWATSYRGPLLIVASKSPRIEGLPAGQAVATATLVGCYRTGDETGNGSDFGWALENVQPIGPFPVKGQLGLYEVEMP